MLTITAQYNPLLELLLLICHHFTQARNKLQS
uniref:Uncharacterized protein n=1 Tax=Anguilla anguilla TaxID=7936 RepID=A0A0E9QHT7_ANGAN